MGAGAAPLSAPRRACALSAQPACDLLCATELTTGCVCCMRMQLAAWPVSSPDGQVESSAWLGCGAFALRGCNTGAPACAACGRACACSPQSPQMSTPCCTARLVLKHAAQRCAAMPAMLTNAPSLGSRVRRHPSLQQQYVVLSEQGSVDVFLSNLV